MVCKALLSECYEKLSKIITDILYYKMRIHFYNFSSNRTHHVQAYASTCNIFSHFGVRLYLNGRKTDVWYACFVIYGVKPVVRVCTVRAFVWECARTRLCCVKLDVWIIKQLLHNSVQLVPIGTLMHAKLLIWKPLYSNIRQQHSWRNNILFDMKNPTKHVRADWTEYTTGHNIGNIRAAMNPHIIFQYLYIGIIFIYKIELCLK